VGADPQSQQSFATLPRNPGSATYDPNAALPSLNDQGSAVAPTQGDRARSQPRGAKRCHLIPTLVNETRFIARSEMGQLAQAAAQIEMMPDLGGNDPAKP
jgi:hypothetical protein